MEKAGSEVEQLAYYVAQEISVMPEIAYTDIMYYPHYYYRDYVKIGGKKSLGDWVFLCEEERKPVKNRKSLR